VNGKPVEEYLTAAQRVNRVPKYTQRTESIKNSVRRVSNDVLSPPIAPLPIIQENSSFAGSSDKWGGQSGVPSGVPSVTSTGSMIRKSAYMPTSIV
jgi:hypothetical protein